MAEMIILGVKRSVGTLDNGRAYNSTKIYVQLPMKESPDQLGFASGEYNWGDAINFDKFIGVKFPIKADVDLDVVTNGKSSQVVVSDVKLASQAK